MIEKIGKNLSWNSASLESFPELNDDDLHLWWLPLKLDGDKPEHALSLLNDIQRDKYHRRATTELKKNYLAGRYYLLNLLGAYTQQAPNEVLLSYSRLNKPSLSDTSLGLEFNFTDTANYGVFAFSKFRHVGVDMERRDRQTNFQSIANRRFTKQELDFVYQHGKINSQRCLAIWTRKEAFGKATGLGINFQMNQRNLYQAKNGKYSDEHRFQDLEGTNWRCLQLSLGESFIASVVHEEHQELSLKAFKSLTI